MNPYAAAVLLAGAVSAGLGAFAWRRRSDGLALHFTLLMLSLTLWALAYALELTTTTLPAMLAWVRVEYLGIAFLPVAWIGLALGYSGRSRYLTRNRLAISLAIPAITVALNWSNDLHHLFYRRVAIDDSGHIPLLMIEPGPWYYVNVAYTYLALAAGTFLFLQVWLRAPRQFRSQAAILLCGALVPWLSNVAYRLGFRPLGHVDITPIAFAVSGLVVAWGLFRHHLLDLRPAARDQVVNSLADGVLVLDRQHRVLDVNPAMLRLLGRPPKDLIGHRLDQILPGGAQWLVGDGTMPAGPQAMAIQVGEELREHEVQVSPLYDQRQQITGRLIVLHDITESRAAEEALRQAKTLAEEQSRQAQAAVQTRNALLSNVSHSLRTPLNIIIGFGQLMAGDANLTTVQRENLETVVHSGTFLLELVNDVLDLAELAGGRAQSRELAFDLYRLLADLAAQFGVQARSKGLAMSFSLSADLPQFVSADSDRLRRIVANLLDNAIKFTERGEVILTARPGTITHGRRLVQIEVQDTGPGISLEEQALIFDAFSQAPGARAVQQGTGLGLTICRELAQRLGGTVSVESRVGQGSTFFLRVPVLLPSAAEVQDLAPVLGFEPSLPEIPGDAVPDRGQDGPALPAGWTARMVQATRLGDVGQMTQLIDELRGHDAALARQLASQADNFEYDQILNVVQNARIAEGVTP